MMTVGKLLYNFAIKGPIMPQWQIQKPIWWEKEEDEEEKVGCKKGAYFIWSSNIIKNFKMFVQFECSQARQVLTI